MKITVAHGPEFVYWDNIGEGFRIDCLCGWSTDAWKSVGGAGSDFDDHLEELTTR